MEILSSDILQFEISLAKAGSPVLSILGDGLPVSSIKSIFEKTNLNISPGLLDLFGWRNGIDHKKYELNPDIDPSLFMLGRFYSLEDNLKDYKYYVDNGYWSRNLFPIFSAGNSEFFLVNCDELSPEFGMLLYYSTTDYLALTPITIFDSIESLILDLTECYAKLIYSYDFESEILLVTNPEQEVKIHVTYNPRSTYWAKINTITSNRQ